MTVKTKALPYASTRLLNWQKDEYDWLLTMDQDSRFSSQNFSIISIASTNFNKKKTSSMFGTNHAEKITTGDFCNSVSVKHLITSGSMLNLKVESEIGGFDENLFIDEVDFEYCLRSVLNGFQVIQFTNIFLEHNLGETVNRRSFKNNKTNARVLHSPQRLYYITRNFLYVQSKYKKAFPDEIRERKKNFLNRIKNNILYQ